MMKKAPQGGALKNSAGGRVRFQDTTDNDTSLAVEDWRVEAEPERPWHISWATYTFMRYEIQRLNAEIDRLTHEVNYWYVASRYTPKQIAEFRHRASVEGKRIDWERGVIV